MTPSELALAGKEALSRIWGALLKICFYGFIVLLLSDILAFAFWRHQRAKDQEMVISQKEKLREAEETISRIKLENQVFRQTAIASDKKFQTSQEKYNAASRSVSNSLGFVASVSNFNEQNGINLRIIELP